MFALALNLAPSTFGRLNHDVPANCYVSIIIERIRIIRMSRVFRVLGLVLGILM